MAAPVPVPVPEVYRIHACILDADAMPLVESLRPTFQTCPEVMVTRAGLYLDDFTAPSSVVIPLLNRSTTHDLDYSVLVLPRATSSVPGGGIGSAGRDGGETREFEIPMRGSMVMCVTDTRGGALGKVWHAPERHRPRVEMDDVRSMCLCVYCVNVHPYTVLDFATVQPRLEGLLVRYREYEGGHRPLHSRSLY
jgi:hypothetical protein